MNRAGENLLVLLSNVPCRLISRREMEDGGGNGRIYTGMSDYLHQAQSRPQPSGPVAVIISPDSPGSASPARFNSTDLELAGTVAVTFFLTGEFPEVEQVIVAAGAHARAAKLVDALLDEDPDSLLLYDFSNSSEHVQFFPKGSFKVAKTIDYFGDPDTEIRYFGDVPERFVEEWGQMELARSLLSDLYFNVLDAEERADVPDDVDIVSLLSNGHMRLACPVNQLYSGARNLSNMLSDCLDDEQLDNLRFMTETGRQAAELENLSRIWTAAQTSRGYGLKVPHVQDGGARQAISAHALSKAAALMIDLLDLAPILAARYSGGVPLDDLLA